MFFKNTPSEIKDLDDNKGIVRAYANAYNNVDSDNDISAPGSFIKTVSDNRKRLRVLKDHISTITLGVPVEINPHDPYGLDTVTQFNMHKEVSRDMYTDIKLALKHGQNAELSIGYSVVQRDQKDKRIIKEYQLYEYSFLSFMAANEGAIVTSIKSLKSSQDVIDYLTEMYNSDYSDTRIKQIEHMLNLLDKGVKLEYFGESLSKGPLQSSTLDEQPILDLINHIKTSFKSN